MYRIKCMNYMCQTHTKETNIFDSKSRLKGHKIVRYIPALPWPSLIFIGLARLHLIVLPNNSLSFCIKDITIASFVFTDILQIYNYNWKTFSPLQLYLKTFHNIISTIKKIQETQKETDKTQVILNHLPCYQ